MIRIVFIFICLDMISCRSASSGNSQIESVFTSDLDKTLWPVPSKIPVCWEQAIPSQLPSINRPLGPEDGEIENYRKKLQERATSEFLKAGIGLVNWTDCKKNDPGIHILVQGLESAFARNLGYKVNGIYAGVILQYPSAISEYALKAGVHELGHAVGLRHEASRIEAKNKCYSYIIDEAEPLSFSIGAYDDNSIMNYCLIDKKPRKSDEEIAHLSEGDIAALKELYSGTVATLSSVPPLTIGIPIYTNSVKYVDQFRYKFGPYATTSCQNEDGYSKVFDSSHVINMPNTGIGETRICLIGFKNEKWQNFATATEYFTNMVQAHTFADYRMKTPFIIDSHVFLVPQPALSTVNVKKVRIKIFEVQRDDNGVFDDSACKEEVGYKSFSYGIDSSLSLDLKSNADLYKVCIIASDEYGKEQSIETANKSYIWPAGPDEAELIFLPLEGLENSTRVSSYNEHILFYDAGIMYVPEQISYSFGPGPVCSEKWTEIDPKQAIRLNTKDIPNGPVLVCIRSKIPGFGWEKEPSLQMGWTKSI